mmetsp:Transcript_14071/g.52798  ORF Transcript_14071/g.52798 Transcript_14071/m.52798 type:complete len:190 (+) Transcript_14071:553-1122(+)
MSYLAATFLLYMSAADAFCCLANMLASHLYRDLYSLDAKRIEKHVRVFDSFFRENLPLLFTHFQRQGVDSRHFFLEWALTLFSRALSIDVAARIWDNFHLHGEIFAIRAGVGVLRLFGPTLAKLEIEEILRLLHRLPCEKTNFSALLFDAIQDVRVDPRKFDLLIGDDPHGCLEQRDVGAEGRHGCSPM